MDQLCFWLFPTVIRLLYIVSKKGCKLAIFREPAAAAAAAAGSTTIYGGS